MAKRKAAAEEEEEILFELALETTNRGNKGGSKLTPQERVKRNLKIVSDRASGVPVPVIANEHGISPRNVRKIVARYRELNPTLRAHDPIEIVDEMLEGMAEDLARLVRAQNKAETDGNLPALIGATNSKTVIRQKMAELLQAVNALPHDLGQLRVVMDGRVLSERLFTVLERRGLLTDEVLDDLIEVLPAPPDAEVVEDAPALAAG